MRRQAKVVRALHSALMTASQGKETHAQIHLERALADEETALDCLDHTCNSTAAFVGPAGPAIYLQGMPNTYINNQNHKISFCPSILTSHFKPGSYFCQLNVLVVCFFVGVMSEIVNEQNITFRNFYLK